jgi:hypothetical protein
MARDKDSEYNPPCLPPDRALNALQKQLAELETFKKRDLRDVECDETQWVHLTKSIIESAFGSPSSQLDEFHRALWAGQQNVTGIGPEQRQVKFELRIGECETLLRSMISALTLSPPEKGIYEPGEDYAFYNELSSLVVQATRYVLFVDAYLNESAFNLYVSKVQSGIHVNILSKSFGTHVEDVASKFAKSNPLSLRCSVDVHDRMVFLDRRAWAIGQSIKGASQKRPMSMIEVTEPLLTPARNVYNSMWSAAQVII